MGRGVAGGIARALADEGLGQMVGSRGRGGRHRVKNGLTDSCLVAPIIRKFHSALIFHLNNDFDFDVGHLASRKV